MMNPIGKDFGETRNSAYKNFGGIGDFTQKDFWETMDFAQKDFWETEKVTLILLVFRYFRYLCNGLK